MVMQLVIFQLRV